MCIQIFILGVLALLASTMVQAIEVNTDLGKIRGSLMTSRLGKTFEAYRGIRYAQPPLGELRFQNPRPVQAWAPATFDASMDGPMCPQPWGNLTDVSEDCLRINVYTKNVNERRPVIVFLHPGGYYVYSGQSKYLAGPEHFMDRDCVLVTLNYRLGSLGFLATGTADAPGNAGLKDQVMALRWIQQHIAHFGGDPKSVTLLGYSAGSLSVGLHMLSPMSRGLFHRGIAMSAAPLGQWTYDKAQLQLAQRQAKLLKCPEMPIADMVMCMKQKPMLDYVHTYGGMFDFGWNPVFNWKPVVEQDFGQERFLVEHPFETLNSGQFHKVPLMAGITEFELLAGAFYDLRNDTVRGWLNNNFEHYAPIALLYERDTERSRQISHALRQKYLGNATLSYPISLEAIEKLYSDAIVGLEYNRFLKLMAQHTDIPVYSYMFRYKGRYSFFKNPDTNLTHGAVHHDELLYLFHVSLVTPLFNQTDPENFQIERLTRICLEFATKGDPHNASDEYLSKLNWPLYNAKDKAYLEIDEHMTPKTGGFYQQRYEIWDELCVRRTNCVTAVDKKQ